MPNENTPAYNADLSQIEALMKPTLAYDGNDLVSKSGIEDFISSLLGQETSADMRRANEERYRDALAFEREFKSNLFLDSTEMQRKVADYEAAGLNPYALTGQAVSPPSVSAGSSSMSVGRAPSLSVNDLLSIAVLPSQIKANLSGAKASDAAAAKSNADAVKSKAEADKIKEDTRGSKLQNDFFEKMRDVREESEKLKNDLDRAERKRIYKDIDLKDSEITKNIEEAHTDQEKQGLIIQQRILANAEAENITAMRPYIQRELSARTDLERQNMRLAAVDEAYRQGLIDAGAIEASVRLSNADASESEIRAEVSRVEKFLKEYSMHRKAGDLVSWLNSQPDIMNDSVTDGLLGALSAVVESVTGK